MFSAAILLATLALTVQVPPTASVSCSLGQFLSDGTCTDCPPGTYQNEENARTCKPCPAGTAYNYPGAVGADLCRRCIPGTFSKPGSTSCTPCPPDTDSRSGSAECFACGPGFEVNYDSTGCKTCGHGFYSSSRSNRSCKQCPEGTATSFTAVSAKSDCRSCPDGYEALNYCRPCGRRFFRSAASGVKQCQPCPRGFFNTKETAAKCKPCPPNTFKTNIYATRCRRCPAGFTSVGGATFCRRLGAPCPTTYFEKDNGDCDRCPVGHFRNLKTNHCEKCPPGTISQGGLVTKCTRCQHGKEPTYERDICLCPPGQESTTGGRCSLCRPGYYKYGAYNPDDDKCTQCGDNNEIAPRPGAKLCKKCRPGLASEGFGGIKCTRCPKGLIPAPSDIYFPRVCVSTKTNCAAGFKRWLGRDGSFIHCVLEKCPKGYFRGYGNQCATCKPGERATGTKPNLVCRDCPKITMVSSGGNSRVCTKCKKGFVRDETDGSQCVCSGKNAAGKRLLGGKCVPCAPGTFNAGDGTGPAKCSECPAGTFADKAGKKKCSNCPQDTFTDEQGATKCKPCPAGSISYGLGEAECLPVNL